MNYWFNFEPIKRALGYKIVLACYFHLIGATDTGIKINIYPNFFKFFSSILTLNFTFVWNLKIAGGHVT